MFAVRLSDSFLYSGDDAVMMSELQHCYVAVRQCSGVSSESKTIWHRDVRS